MSAATPLADVEISLFNWTPPIVQMPSAVWARIRFAFHANASPDQLHDSWAPPEKTASRQAPQPVEEQLLRAWESLP